MKRYILHNAVGQGGMGTVHRATDRLTGQIVALKRVSTPAKELNFTSKVEGSTNLQLSLVREFQILASLRHPHIISVLDYGFDTEHQPYFTMEFVEGAQTIIEAAAGKSLEHRLMLVEQMLHALHYLHRRGVLHRDLKPANVLVVDGQVKVLDFGVSVAVNSNSIMHITQTTAGTLAYMSPEVIMGEAITPAADLYAVGVMLYQLVVGQHPFTIENIGQLFYEVMNKPVEIPAAVADDELATIIKKLMSKTVETRYSNAAEVLADLQGGWQAESREIRDSFLQAARFVGRENELEMLVAALEEAQDGQGAVWLVSGESGVGKSRLLDELRIRALVSREGMLVVRGQTAADGSSPYLVWQTVLRMLALYVDLTVQQAGILKAVAHDIAQLIGMKVVDAPPLEPQPAQSRLFRTIKTLFQKQPQPVMVILEDLQWAGSESLALLDWLSHLVVGLPILIVGTYRDDERPDLPQMVASAKLLKLRRLSAQGIADLSASMLGEIGRSREIVTLLQRESEGNVFFLVEVVRALAEQAGRLDRIDSHILPEKVLAGGIQEIIQRRLHRIPRHARSLLRLAAVAGREIDLAVLAKLEPTRDLTAWLEVCSDAAVLHFFDSHWRFAHDKLREGILDAIPPAELPTLHSQVAEAIEAVYPDAIENVAALSAHWGAAGVLRKEFHYAALAGQQAFMNNREPESIAYLSRAIALIQQMPYTTERDRQELHLQLPLCLALMTLKGYSALEAETAWLRARELCERMQNPPEFATVLYGIGVFYLVRGRFTEGLENARQILALAELSPYGNYLRTCGLLMSTCLHVLMGNFSQSRQSADAFLEIYQPEMEATHLQIYGVGMGALEYVWSGTDFQFTGYADRAIQHLTMAMQKSNALAHPFTQVYVLTFCAGCYYVWRDVEKTQEYALKALEILADHPYENFCAYASGMYGWSLLMQGKEEEAAHSIHEGYKIFVRSGAKSIEPIMLGVMAQLYHKQGQIEEALATLDKALMVMRETGESCHEADILRMKGDLLYALGDEAIAEAYFEQALGSARVRQAKFWELRTSVSLARLWQSQGKRDAAYNMLSNIYDWFTEGCDLPDMQQARELLAELQQRG